MPTVVLYSEDPAVRAEVRMAVGRSPAAGVDDVVFLECEDHHQVRRAVDEGLVDLLVLEGEAAPIGGLGLCRELKNSAAACPPVLAIIARRDDTWLAGWSMADAVLPRPLDAWDVSRTVVALLLGQPLPEGVSGARTGVLAPQKERW